MYKFNFEHLISALNQLNSDYGANAVVYRIAKDCIHQVLGDADYDTFVGLVDATDDSYYIGDVDAGIEFAEHVKRALTDKGLL